MNNYVREAHGHASIQDEKHTYAFSLLGHMAYSSSLPRRMAMPLGNAGPCILDSTHCLHSIFLIFHLFFWSSLPLFKYTLNPLQDVIKFEFKTTLKQNKSHSKLTKNMMKHESNEKKKLANYSKH